MSTNSGEGRVEDGMVLAYNRLKMNRDVIALENARLVAEVKQLRAALEQIAGIDRVKYVEAPLLEVQRIARGAVRG